MPDPSDDSETIAPRPSGRADPELKKARAVTKWLGRASTSQRQLLDLFVAALVADFKEGGPEAIATLRRYDPVNYLRLIAVTVPRQLADANSRNDEYDEEVADALDRVQELVDAYASGLDPRDQGFRQPAPAPALPALPQAD